MDVWPARVWDPRTGSEIVDQWVDVPLAGAHRFRYADGRVEWRTPMAPTDGLIVVTELTRDGGRSRVVEHVFHAVRFREATGPGSDVLEYHEHNFHRPTRSWLIGEGWADIERDRERRRRGLDPLIPVPGCTCGVAVASEDEENAADHAMGCGAWRR